MRELYSQLYLESNCTLPFNDTTTVDDTIGTYTTNYLILVIGLVIAFLLALNIPNSKNRRCCCSRPIIFYFVFTALGYGLAGLSHQMIHTKEDKWNQKLNPIYYALVLAGNTSLLASVLFPSPCNCNDNACRNGFLGTALFGLHVAILVISVKVGESVLGIFLLVSVIGMAAVYTSNCEKSCWNVAKSCSMIIYAGGLIVQVTLRKTCGDKGYRNCFRDCPLPNPANFNHNALFHLMVLTSLISLGIAES